MPQKKKCSFEHFFHKKNFMAKKECHRKSIALIMLISLKSLTPSYLQRCKAEQSYEKRCLPCKHPCYEP